VRSVYLRRGMFFHTIRFRPSPHPTARILVTPGLDGVTKACTFDDLEEAREALREKGCYCLPRQGLEGGYHETWVHRDAPIAY